MAWTTPTIRATGYLVTASDWNTDIVDNLAYLKGEAGLDIEIEDDIVPSAGTEKLGKDTDPWDEGHFDKLFAGPRCAIHKFVREIVVNWESADNMGGGSGGGGNQNLAGVGQYLLYVDDDNAGSNAYVDGNNAAANSKATPVNASRNPYGRFEFNLDSLKTCQQVFIGFRTTPSGNWIGAAEKYAGLVIYGGTYACYWNDGSTPSGGGISSPTINTRHVVEILIIGGDSVEFYLDGVLVKTATGALPTGDLHWTELLFSDGSGGIGEHSYLTLGKVIIQEDLS
jgi:hypothetical protein